MNFFKQSALMAARKTLFVTAPATVSFIGRMTLRDWRAGELRLLIAALVVAVGAITAVGFLVDRIRLGFERDATQLLGGDVVLSSDRPLPGAWLASAQQAQLQTAQIVTFPSMAQHRDRAQLSALKAVSADYPLRGALQVMTASNAPEQGAQGIPNPGTVWVDAPLLSSLNVQIGDVIQLGNASFRIEKLITLEPDRGSGFINFAPRVLLRLDDLPTTQLLQEGARVTYRLLVAGEAAQIKTWRNSVQAQLKNGQRLEALDESRPEMQQALERAQQFLALVALLTVFLAAVAVALAARRYSLRHIDACAVMRCLGSSQNQLGSLFAGEFLVVGVVASLLGALLGYAAHFALLQGLASFLKSSLPLPSALPALQGLVVGVVLLLGFAVPPLLQLRRVPPLRVLRRELGEPQAATLLTYGLGTLAFFVLLVWLAGDQRLGLIAGAGFIGGLFIFAAASWLALKSLARLRRFTQRSAVFRLALAGTTRRSNATVVQVVALAVGLMALLLLTVTRTDLINAWRSAAPAEAPNRFVINIQPDQRAAFSEQLQQLGLGAPALLPMVRGRLIAINEQPVSLDNYEGRARRLVDREFNLSYMSDMPRHNQLTSGRWFSSEAQEISVEQGLMKTLGLQLGDRLRFDIAGNEIEARISSTRKVQWDSFQVNFFVIFPPALLQNMPQSYITSFHMPAQKELGPRLLTDFPNITVVDTTALLRQVQDVLEQVIAAVEFLFLFSLIAGVLVLYAALASSQDERSREAAILRALGASQRQLKNAQIFELIFIGALAGLLAALGASVMGAVLAYTVFDLALAFNPWVFLSGILAGAAIAVIGGWLSLRRVLQRAPLASLRT